MVENPFRVPKVPEVPKKSSEDEDPRASIRAGLEEVVSAQRELDRDELLKIVSRVFEHSVSDGIELADRLRMTPEELRECTVYRNVFALKHRYIQRKLETSISRDPEWRELPEYDQETLQGVSPPFEKIREAELKAQYSRSQGAFERAEDLKKRLSSGAVKLLEEVDAAYTGLFKLNRQSGKERQERGPDPLDTVRSFLFELKESFGGKEYYSGDAVPIIEGLIRDNVKSGGPEHFNTFIETLRQKQIFPSSMFEWWEARENPIKYLLKENLITRTELQAKLKRDEYKMSPFVYQALRGEAIGILKEQIAARKRDPSAHFSFSSDDLASALDSLQNPSEASVSSALNRLSEYDSGEWWKDQRERIEVHHPIRATIQEHPEWFLDVNPVDVTDSKQTYQSLVQRLFPGLPKNISHRKYTSFPTREKPDSKSGFGEYDRLSPRERARIDGGYLGTDGDALSRDKVRIQMMELSAPVHEFLLTNVYSAYDKEEGVWSKELFPIQGATERPGRIVKATVPLRASSGAFTLPRPVDSEITDLNLRTGRLGRSSKAVKGRTNALGETTVETGATSGELTYSFKTTEPEMMRRIKPSEMSEFRTRFGARWRVAAESLSKGLGEIPERFTTFLKTKEFKSLDPVEQVKRIESYVRGIGYYDFENDEVLSEKFGVSLEDQWNIAQERMLELKKRSEGNEAVTSKEFAGVCTDFAKLTCALLREAGFLSGVATGFSVAGKEVSADDAHAVAFVVWPQGKDGVRIVTVEGTPATPETTALGFSGPTIAEREEAVRQKVEREVEEAEMRLQKAVHALEKNAISEIRAIDRTDLQGAMKVVIEKELRDSDVQSIRSLFNVYLYSSLKDLDIKDVKNRSIFVSEIVEELDQQRIWRKKHPQFTENEKAALLQELKSVAERFVKSKKASSVYSAYQRMQALRVIAQNGLNAHEQRMLDLALTYLRVDELSKGNENESSKMETDSAA